MAVRALDALSPRELRETFQRFSDNDLEVFVAKMRWRALARQKQLPPDDNKWDFFGIKSGRGFGKTVSGARWLVDAALGDPGSYNFVIAPTHDDLIKTCFYGPTGIHGAYEDKAGVVGPVGTHYPILPSKLIKHSTKSPPEVTLINDAKIMGFSAEVAERLRGPQCFVPSTLVTLGDETKKCIEDIRVGDSVMTRCGLRKVTRAWYTDNRDVWRLYTRNGLEVFATPEHPIYSPGVRRFIPLRNLRRGMYVEPYEDIGWDQVESVKKWGNSDRVYDLTVEGEHEFFANGILVHNCHRGWLDEVASWRDPEKAFDNFIFGLRLGKHPQVFWTGTPKPKPFIKMLMNLPRSITISGSTYENAENLSDVFYENIAKYEGTRIGRQEIYGEVIDPEEAGFVKRSHIRLWPANKPLPKFRFVVMSLDTAFTEETWNKKEQTGDPTAGTVWGLFEHERRDHIMLLDAWEEYLGFPQLIRRVKHERSFTYGDTEEPVLRPALISRAQRPSHQGRKIDLLLIEDTGSGKSLIQMLAVEGVLATPFPTDMDKLSKLHGASPLFAHGRVWAVESPNYPGQPMRWAEPVVSQLCTYVGEGSLAHDDLLDTATQALLFLMQRFNIRLTVRADPVKAAIEASERLKQQKRSNPYDG